MTSDPVRPIADAVLYEGYILWPYRRSALKNQRRFTFGGVYPPAHSERHPDDACSMQTEVLLHSTARTRLQITVRFLQIVQRTVTGPDGEPLDELVTGGERYLSWEEAVERELAVPPVGIDDPGRAPIAIAAGCRRERLAQGAGALIRSWESLDGQVVVATVPVCGDIARASVQVLNATPAPASSRQDALRRTLCSTHTLLRVHEGEFVSSTAPPASLAPAAGACRNVGTWPVLIGEPPDRSMMLSSPIILEDYPRVAPESPGDMFDGGEIDQLLILSILALTDDEKAEMAASDPRARQILQRAEALTPEQLLALHGRLVR